MSSLLIPVAPFSYTKSRLRDCFSIEELKDFTIAMFKDLGKTLTEVKCFKHKIIYTNSTEILELTEFYGLIGIKEVLSDPLKSFDDVIKDFNTIAMEEFNATQTVLAFVDLVLITAKNFIEIDTLLKKNQIVVCPAIQSAGISILGRNPPDIIETSFSDPNVPSLVALFNKVKNKRIDDIFIFDSFRAGFDIDIKQDLVLAYEYLKIFNLTHTEVFKFLKDKLKFTLNKKNPDNNRFFHITEK
jgi:2-phospho-L-lactate guanylyltransferase (CobY/MobA/RfbA family)